MSDWKKLRDAANGQLSRVGMRTEDLVRWRQDAHPEKILALLDENDSLRAEVERLRGMVDGLTKTSSECNWNLVRTELQLSAALAAKEEACDLFFTTPEQIAAGFDPAARIHALRSIGKDGGNG